MRSNRVLLLLLGVSFTLFPRAAMAEGPGGNGDGEPREHKVVVGVGGAGELELDDGGALHGGGNLFVELEAVPEWLELELGASVLAVDGGYEAPIELLFKKPFRLSSRAELMIGIGPEVVRESGTDKSGTFGGVGFGLDFMFWPSRHVGVWLEPAYDLVVRDRATGGVGSTGGVIFGW